MLEPRQALSTKHLGLNSRGVFVFTRVPMPGGTGSVNADIGAVETQREGYQIPHPLLMTGTGAGLNRDGAMPARPRESGRCQFDADNRD